MYLSSTSCIFVIPCGNANYTEVVMLRNNTSMTTWTGQHPTMRQVVGQVIFLGYVVGGSWASCENRPSFRRMGSFHYCLPVSRKS